MTTLAQVNEDFDRLFGDAWNPTMQHHCASSLQSTTDEPRAMTKPLSERLEELVQGCHGPRSSVIREAAALARRVEGAGIAFIFSKAAPEPHQVSGLTEEDDAVIDSLDCQRVALVPVEGGA